MSKLFLVVYSREKKIEFNSTFLSEVCPRQWWWTWSRRARRQSPCIPCQTCPCRQCHFDSARQRGRTRKRLTRWSSSNAASLTPRPASQREFAFVRQLSTHLSYRTRWSNIVHITSKKTKLDTTDTATSSPEQRSTPETTTVRDRVLFVPIFKLYQTARKTERSRFPRRSPPRPLADFCDKFNRTNHGKTEHATGHGSPWRGVQSESDWRIDHARAVWADTGMFQLDLRLVNWITESHMQAKIVEL